MSGRLRRTMASSVSRHAARIGSAAFLFPPGRMRPSSRRPPSTMNRSIMWRDFMTLATAAFGSRHVGRALVAPHCATLPAPRATTPTIVELTVQARRTPHDAADRACFMIEARDGTRVSVASDLGHADATVIRHLSDCDGLFFEANHDLDMLRMGSYPWSLKRRIMSRFGHLSNDDSMTAVQRMIGADLKNLCLIHLSERNNHESIVGDIAGRLLSRLGVTNQLELSIAKQFEATGVYEISRRRPARPRLPALNTQMALF